MRTLLIGPRSKIELTHGMSMAFDLLVSGYEMRELDHVVIDRSYKQADVVIGSFFLSAIPQTIMFLLRVYRNLIHADIIYITIGTSRLGVLKDAMMIWPSRFLNKRIVLHLHGGGLLSFYQENSPWFRSMMEKTYEKADTLIVLGELLRDQFSFTDGGELKVKVVPNGLPIISRKIAPKQITQGEPIRLLYLSNLIPSKGYLDVLEACHILVNKRGLPLHCDFCGSFIRITGEDGSISPEEAEESFFQNIKKFNLGGVVKYHGVVRGDKKTHILEKANVLILPTSYPWEGQPLSIIEALAFGNPVISTHYRGIPEEVIDGYNGYLVEFGDAAQIANKIEIMWNSPDQYFLMSKNAITHYEQYFTQDAHLNRLIPIIMNDTGMISEDSL